MVVLFLYLNALKSTYLTNALHYYSAPLGKHFNFSFLGNFVIFYFNRFQTDILLRIIINFMDFGQSQPCSGSMSDGTGRSQIVFWHFGY